jgi:hypothetical protein
MRNPRMNGSESLNTARKTFIPVMLGGLIIFLAIGVTARPQVQTDWRQWTAKDVHTILTKSPWVSRCCRDWDTMTGANESGADPGFIAIIVS